MSHYITCHNCGEPECMDSDTGVHRRDDGTVCPDPRDAVIEGLRAEVERMKAERDEAEGARILNANALKAALAANEAMGREDYLNKQAIRVGGDAVRELNAEVARLRAAALPEDAEEIVFKELSIGVVEPQDLEIQEAIHAKRRAKASAVVKALRGDA